jgi:type IV secretory pathway VirB9-like protein
MKRLVPLCLLLLTVPAAAQSAAPAWAKTWTKDPIREETIGTAPIQIVTKIRYLTNLQFPIDDPIMDVLGGDGGTEDKPANWVITSTKPVGLVHIKPTKEGATTNLLVITKSGTAYNLLLREGRADGKPLDVPDILVTLKSDRPTATPEPARTFYSSAEYDAVQAEVITLRAQLEAERHRSESLAAAPPPTPPEPKPMHFDYHYKDNKIFNVRAIWNDGQFTYIRHEARESPTVYERRDGKHAILDPRIPQPGLFVIPKIIDQGGLAIGNEHLDFTRKD